MIIGSARSFNAKTSHPPDRPSVPPSVNLETCTGTPAWDAPGPDSVLPYTGPSVACKEWDVDRTTSYE